MADPVIEKTMPNVPFGELNWCYTTNIAFQRETEASVPYDEAYFQKYVGYEGTEIANKLNASRVNITHKYCDTLLDIGIGSGEFIKKSTAKVYGFDINPVGIDWLKERDLFVNPYQDNLQHIKGFCFWDSLEHIPQPSALFNKLPYNSYVFISIPIFRDVLAVRKSKHYRPNEHYYYFSQTGLIDYMHQLEYHFKEISDGEILAGREDIYTYVFQKINPLW